MLCIWLPLNGDLRNQGLLGNSVFSSNGNAIVNDNGKIGKCYSFDGENSYLIADFKPDKIVPNEMSFCCWVKLNKINYTHTLFSSRKITGAGLSIFILSNNRLRFDNGNDQNNSTNWTTFNYNFVANIWYHIAVIQTNTQKKLYINGVLWQSINKASANLGNNSATKCTIGAAGNNDATGNWLDGYLNDVRVYDHALSEKEIEELAKGLIVHYKLNLGNPNLLYEIPKKYLSTVYSPYEFNLKENLQANQIYTMQLWDVTIVNTGKTNNNIGLSVYWGGGSISLKTCNGISYYDRYDEATHTIHADYMKFTFTPTEDNANHSHAANAWLRIYNSVSNIEGMKDMHIGAWKLEKGNIATKINNSDSIIYDSSGYNYNGILNGTLKTINISPRYNYAMKFDGIDNQINTNNNFNFLNENPFTVSIWVKCDDWSTATNTGNKYIIYCYNKTNGGFRIFSSEDTNRYRIYWIDTNGTGRNVWFSEANAITEGWHLFTATYNGETMKTYLDGIYYSEGQYSFKLTTAAPSLRISTGASGLAGSYSDFRLYATALSPEQIVDLYHTSATIDNEGNIYSREFIESSNLSVTQSGVFEANEITDGDYQMASILKDTNTIQGNNLYEY